MFVHFEKWYHGLVTKPSFCRLRSKKERYESQKIDSFRRVSMIIKYDSYSFIRNLTVSMTDEDFPETSGPFLKTCRSSTHEMGLYI